ncbi:MAG: phage tail sheath family protein [Oscillospiraceae bacterium]|nr:phage tail sheath family protein [Oscillospiraceae bacterium]
MAFGGGTFIAQNKTLPGSYINFVSAGRASAVLSERGIAAMPLKLSWGPVDEVFTVTSDSFLDSCREIFGYDSTAYEMRGIRELFMNARMAHFYRLGDEGAKAENLYGRAKYPGVRGNLITIVTGQNVDNVNLFDVKTIFDGRVVDVQSKVGGMEDLLDNDFVDWKRNEEITPVTAGMPMTGGLDGEVRDGDYVDFLSKIESFSFHTLGLVSDNQTLCGLFAEFTKRMRDTVGVKFQTVLFRYPQADHEGIISLENECISGDGASNSEDRAGLVYWVTGLQSGCPINSTLTGNTYNGEMSVAADLTQATLEDALKNGKFVLHRVGDTVRILQDINTLKSWNAEKNEDFSDNQAVRVLDQIGNDIAVLFNEKYLGKMPNDAAGRTSLWSDITSHHKQLQTLRAIEDFSTDDVAVNQGDNKKSVVVTDRVTPVCAMTQLYMTVVVE